MFFNQLRNCNHTNLAVIIKTETFILWNKRKTQNARHISDDFQKYEFQNIISTEKTKTFQINFFRYFMLFLSLSNICACICYCARLLLKEREKMFGHSTVSNNLFDTEDGILIQI